MTLRPVPLARITQAHRFVVVGVINSAFGFAVFAGLQLSLGRFVHYLVVLCVAHVVAVLEAFTLQRFVVYKSRGPWLPELARFWYVTVGVTILNVPLLLLFVEVFRIPVLLAQFGTLLILGFGTFLAHRSFTFSRADPSQATFPDAALASERPLSQVRKNAWNA